MEYRQGTAEISEAEIWEKEVPSPSSMEEVDGGWVRRFGPGGRQGTCPTLILPRGGDTNLEGISRRKTGDLNKSRDF